MSSILPKNLQNIVITNMTSSNTTIMAGSVQATHTTNTFGNIFTIGGNVGVSTTNPLFTLDTPGTIRASTGMLISGNSVLEFGHNVSGKNADAGKIGYNTWTSGLNIVGSGSSVGSRLVYIYDNLQVSTSSTLPSLRVTGSTISAATNNYSLTSGSLNVSGDTVLSGTELMFTTTGVNPPTMNGRSSGTKIVLYPQTNTTQGDFSIGVENGATWFQVPQAGHQFKFYQGTSANLIINTNGNVGIGTTNTSYLLDVNGTARISSQLLAAHNSNTIGSIITTGGSLGIGTSSPVNTLHIHNPTASSDVRMIISDGTTGVSASRGLHLIKNGSQHSYLWNYENGFLVLGTNNASVIGITGGNVGIGTNTPSQVLDVNGSLALSNPSGSKMFLGNPTTGAARLNIRDFSTNLVEFQYGTNTIGNINCLANGTGLLLKGGGTNQLVLASNGNIGIETTSPSAKLHIVGNGASSNIFEGVDHTYLQFYPFGYSAGRKTWLGFGNSNVKDFTIYNEATAGSIILNTTALGGSIQFINNTTTAMTITGGNVGIGTTSPNSAYLLDVNGTIDALTVTTGNLSNGTATIGTLLNTTLINYGRSAQWIINGGGNVNWSGTNVLWSARVIIIPVKRSEFSTVGYIDINCPTSGTVTYYNSSNVTTTVTCTASGIPLGGWDALYYEITPGQTNTSDQTKFRVVNYGNSTWRPTSNWILIAVVNGDNTSLKWIPGNTYIPSGKVYYSDNTNNWQINGTTNYIPKFNAANTLTANSIIFDNGTSVGIGTTQPATGYTTTIPNARLSILSGVAGNNNGASRISIGGDNSHYSAIEGAHTASGATTLAFMTCLNASTNSANPLTRMFITAAGDIAIGSTVPSYKLDVNGVIKNNADIIMSNASRLTLYNDSGALQIRSNSTNMLHLNQDNNGNISMVVGGGSVGIGTTSPSFKLDVNGDFRAYGGRYIIQNAQDGGTGRGIYMWTESDTNWGIYMGQSGAGKSFSGGTATTGVYGFASFAVRFRIYHNPSPNTGWIFENSNEGHAASIRSDGQMYIAGNLGIATASPSFTLHVNGNARADNIYNNGWFRNYGDQGLYNEDYGCHFYRNDTYYGNWRIHGNAVGNWNGLRFTQADISVMAGDGGTKRCGFHYNGTGWGIYVDENRNFYCPGNITAYWSDRRLKTNLQQLSNFDHVLTSLTGYTFNWNEKGKEILQKSEDELDIGLIAQDVQKVIPQAVQINKAGQSLDKDAEPFDYLTINYDKIIPYLVEGYKAQRSEIQAQKSEIQELKSKVEKLEELVQQLLNKF